MGYLINAWNESQKKFTMTLKQIVNIAGDESLESDEAVKEMRDFFGLIDLPTLERLLQECYSKEKKLKFDARGFAFQDLVNEMGKRLGYKVEYGLYRGKRNDIGFDGLWRHKDGSCIIMESKASGDYAFAPETVIGYREELISSQRVAREKCSILVVYGRDDKGTLRNAVKGSDGAATIRLISSNALFQLVKKMYESKSEVTAKQVFSLLQPRDYFVLDNLVELVFPETDDSIMPVEDGEDERSIRDEKGDLVGKGIVRNETSREEYHNGLIQGNLPPLPDSTLKVGLFVYNAMKNLSIAGYVFSEEQLQRLCADAAMKNVMGMQRALPFLKLYDPNEEHGNYIDSRPRYYKEPLQFGDVRVYINSQIYKTDREPFIMWYEALESSFREAAQKHCETEKTEVQLIPPLPDKSLKVGRFIRTAMENLSKAGYVFPDDQMQEMCSNNWMHDVVGMSRRLPFFKRYDPNDQNGPRVDGVVRYYSQPLCFGRYMVYLTKELFSGDKEPFILWYESLKTDKCKGPLLAASRVAIPGQSGP